MKPGPTTLAELFKWPRMLLNRLEQSSLMWTNFCENSAVGTTTSSCFSGVMFRNISFSMLMKEAGAAENVADW
eukprot:5769351-Alexandrium_andersonii.AAC.1